MHLIVAVIFILAAYRWGDWKNWHVYYPTMLFWGFGDLAYNCLFHDKMLWEYSAPTFSTIPHILWSLVWICFVFVSSALVFLARLPQHKLQRAAYIFAWITLYTAIEFILLQFGCFTYYNGWGLAASFIFNCYMFPLVYIHYKKPLLAWPFVIAGAVFAILYFDVPLLNHEAWLLIMRS